MIAYLPDEIKDDKAHALSASIVSSNTDPDWVWDVAFLESTEDVRLSYVSGSARIYNNGALNNTTLDDSIFSEYGTKIGIDHLDGMLPGGTGNMCIILCDFVVEKAL